MKYFISAAALFAGLAFAQDFCQLPDVQCSTTNNAANCGCENSVQTLYQEVCPDYVPQYRHCPMMPIPVKGPNVCPIVCTEGDCECEDLVAVHCAHDYGTPQPATSACSATPKRQAPNHLHFGPGLACVHPSIGCAEDDCGCNNYQLILDFKACGRMMDTFEDDRWNATCSTPGLNPHFGIGLPCVAPSNGCSEDDCVCNNFQLIEDFKTCGRMMDAFEDSRWNSTCDTTTPTKRQTAPFHGLGLPCVAPSIGCSSDDCACNNYQLVLDYKTCGRVMDAFTDARYNSACDA